MIMKNQLLNLKMIALMCLMMVLGGANVWAEEVTFGPDWNTLFGTSHKGSFSLQANKLELNGGSNGVKIKVVNGSSQNGYIKKSDFRVYTGYKIVFTAPEGSNILSISSSVSTNDRPKKFPNGKVTADVGNLTINDGALNWTGSSNSVTFSISGTGSFNTITITYTSTSNKTLTSLTISGTPEKTTYNAGEEFDPTGLVVTGTYDDNTTATITDGITWTKNPATLSLNDVSCSVTATVGGITSPAYHVTGLTVNKAKLPATTDATFGPDWDKLFGTSYNGQIRSLKANKLELNGVSNGVKIKVTNGTSTNGYVKTNDFRLYGKYTITITAPKDVLLSEITMTSQTQNKDLKIEENKITSNVGSVKLDGEDLKWIGSSNEIQFKFSDKVSLSTIKVATKAATAEPTYTAQTLTLKATDGSYNYSTFSSDKVTFFPGDGGVFPLAVTVKGNIIEQDYNVFKEETVTIDTKAVKGLYVPANTGVMLMSDFADVTYYTVDNYTVAALTADANMLKPAPATTSVFTAETGYKYYKLAYDNYDARTGLGFYWGADNGGAFKVKAGTAYLAVHAGDATAKGFTLNGEATGIEGVNANVENAKAIYNLNGQRVASMAKPGLYIVNGKKVIRK